MPNTKEKGKLIEVLSKHIPYGYATLCLIADELMAEGVTFATDNNVGDKWISVKDRLPKERGYYFISVKYSLGGKPITKEAFWDGADWVSCYRTRVKVVFTKRVTHWQYLPQPPKGE